MCPVAAREPPHDDLRRLVEARTLRVVGNESDRSRERSADAGLLDRELEQGRFARVHDRWHCTCSDRDGAFGHTDPDERRKRHDHDSGGQAEELRDA